MTDPWFLETDPIVDAKQAAFVTDMRQLAERWQALGIRREDTNTWVHDGWIMLSVDIVKDKGIVKTLRLDVGDLGMRGGRSPANLNWDHGVPAIEAGVDLTPPRGISHGELLPDVAIAWFEANFSHD